MTVLTSLFLLAVTTSEGTLQTFDVGGMEGQAVVYSNVQKVEAAAAPLVFVFHGRGGHAERSAVRFKVHEHSWSSPGRTGISLIGSPKAPHWRQIGNSIEAHLLPAAGPLAVKVLRGGTLVT